MRDHLLPARVTLVLLFTLIGFAVMGYHPGLEDDGLYLAAVKAQLNPGLYPHDASFFRLEMQASVFDTAMAQFVRVTRMPVPWAELFWQFASLFAILWACHGIARQLFPESRAQWGGVAMVAAMFTLPVAGTALYLADQHLHPRNVATALILLGASGILAGKPWRAVLCPIAAIPIHPIMAVLGLSLCVFLSLAMLDAVHGRVAAWSERWGASWSASATAILPLGWLLERPNSDWLKALSLHPSCIPIQWAWYEWLGVAAPPFLFWLLWRLAVKRGERLLARFALAVFAYGVFQQCLAMFVLTPARWIRVMPLQPMRYLQLVYLAMVLLAGCLLGRYLLHAKAWRWAVYLLAINGVMLIYQLAAYAGSAHLELPGERPANPWLEAFAWISQNTPRDAYFALDPYYIQAPGEDYHGFRALAERSQLADMMKDSAVAMQVPELAPVWARQVEAQEGWRGFQLEDFERLKARFGVDWTLVSFPAPAGLDCQWHNASLAVCRIP